MRSLNANDTTATPRLATRSGASTWCADIPAALSEMISLFWFIV